MLHCVDRLPGRRSPRAASCPFTFSIWRKRFVSVWAFIDSKDTAGGERRGLVTDSIVMLSAFWLRSIGCSSGSPVVRGRARTPPRCLRQRRDRDSGSPTSQKDEMWGIQNSAEILSCPCGRAGCAWPRGALRWPRDRQRPSDSGLQMPQPPARSRRGSGWRSPACPDAVRTLLRRGHRF